MIEVGPKSALGEDIASIYLHFYLQICTCEITAFNASNCEPFSVLQFNSGFLIGSNPFITHQPLIYQPFPSEASHPIRLRVLWDDEEPHVLIIASPTALNFSKQGFHCRAKIFDNRMLRVKVVGMPKRCHRLPVIGRLVVQDPRGCFV
jgi:hypothetical protein